jgi:hypothetical protein
MLLALVPIVAAHGLMTAAVAAPGGWRADRYTEVTASGGLAAKVCCKGELSARRAVTLPAGGTITVDASAPCWQSLWIGIEGSEVAARPPTAPGPFDGVLTLTVPPGPPRTLRVYASGGLSCCGPVEIRRVIVTAAPPT